LLWAIYHLFVLIFRDASARMRHGLAAMLLTIGAAWTILTFITTYWLGTADSPYWLGPATGAYLLPASLQPYGNRLLSVSRWFIDEGLSWCSFGYLLVLGGLLIHYTGHYLRSRRITKMGLSKIGPGFRIFVAETARNMGILPVVKVHLSSLVDVPVTLGFLRPMILLPVAMITHLTTQQIEAILVHELAHIRRKDYLINILVTVMELVFFFNPFARMLIGQLKKEREHCCDDLVLQFQYDAHAYVSALLSLARQHRHGRLAVAATGGDNKLLLQRAKKILQHHRSDDRPGARPLFLLFLTIGMTLLFWGPRRMTPPLPPASVAMMRPAGTAHPYIETDKRLIVNIASSNVKSLPPTNLSIAHLPPTHIATRAIAHASAPSATHHGAASPVSHRRATHPPAAGAFNEDEATWFRTSGPSNTPAPAYADLVVIDSRDYSIGSPSGNGQTAVAPPTASEGFPFVPQSSFSFHYTDTLPPEDRLAIMEKVTEKAIRLQISQLREELKTRLNALQAAQAALDKASRNPTLSTDLQSASRKQLKQLLKDQLLLQQRYMLRLDDLQRQLKQAARRLTTVYI
jgi:hypothetical protein